MKIAIVSDTHNKVKHVRTALAEIRRRGIRTVLHCGDITDTQVIELFTDLDTHFVLGNCDQDTAELRGAMTRIGATLHDNFGHLDLDGKKIAFVHGHERDLLHDLEASGGYDYLFHGHTHVRADRQDGPTRVINPGAMQRVVVKTFAVLDLGSGVLETIVIEQ